jgi:hypothetical protein
MASMVSILILMHVSTLPPRRLPGLLALMDRQTQEALCVRTNVCHKQTENCGTPCTFDHDDACDDAELKGSYIDTARRERHADMASIFILP